MKKRYWIFIIAVLILGVLWFNSLNLIVYYYNHFSGRKAGEDLYLREDSKTDTTFNYVTLYQMVRPITGHDIDTMHIDSILKQAKKMDLDTVDQTKRFLVTSNLMISLDTLKKYNSKSIGKYVKDCVLDWGDFGKPFPYYFRQILPFPKAIVKPNMSDHIPKGYVVNDNLFYILGIESKF